MPLFPYMFRPATQKRSALLLSYPFPIAFFGYIVYENTHNESVNSIHSFISVFHSDDSTYFSSRLFLKSSFYFCESLKIFSGRTGTGRYKKAAGLDRPTTSTCPWQVVLVPRSTQTQLFLFAATGTPGQTKHPWGAKTASSGRESVNSSRLLAPLALQMPLRLLQINSLPTTSDECEGVKWKLPRWEGHHEQNRPALASRELAFASSRDAPDTRMGRISSPRRKPHPHCIL